MQTTLSRCEFPGEFSNQVFQLQSLSLIQLGTYFLNTVRENINVVALVSAVLH